MIKTFRGLLNNGAQERIRLQHIDGKTGYRIKKFEVMTKNPMSGTTEAVMKAYSISQSSIDAVVDFSEQTLLAVGIMLTTEAQDMKIFDNGIVNQDIFITYATQAGSDACNYYLELETISLDDVEATAVILKNFRNTNTVV